MYTQKGTFWYQFSISVYIPFKLQKAQFGGMQDPAKFVTATSWLFQCNQLKLTEEIAAFDMFFLKTLSWQHSLS